MQAGSKSLIALAVRAKRLRSLGLAGCRVGVRGSGDDGVTNAALTALAHCASNGRLTCLRSLDLEHCRLVSAPGAGTPRGWWVSLLCVVRRWRTAWLC